ncbi:MAG: hypothetical protein GX149_04695 [Acholeplasmataceae bacterium]|jgi:hypothetical protein|nr:hypothetical protein [Acholeplasmataceae bacterium]
MAKKKKKQPLPAKKTEIKPKPNKQLKIVFLTTVSVLVVAVLVVVLWWVFKDQEDPEKPLSRFEEITHISVEQYQVILNQIEISDLDDEEKEQFEALELKHDVYVLVYSNDYDVCVGCGEIEEIINEKNAIENKNFTILVLHYEENLEIDNLIGDNYLPNVPVLIHIEGETVAEDGIYTDDLAIKRALSFLN